MQFRVILQVQLLFCVAAVLLGLVGCGSGKTQDSPAAPAPTAKFMAQIVSWQKGPQVTKSDDTRNELQVKILGPNGADPEKVEVLNLFPYMKVHGHGVPKSFEPKWEVQGNVIQVRQLGFIMSGPWEVNIKARVNGVEDTIEIPVEVP